MDMELAYSPGRPPPPLSPTTEPFRYERRDLGAGVVRLSLRGELDLACARELDAVLCVADAGAEILVLDLDRLKFIDVSGARALRAAAERARGNGRRLIAVNAPEHVERWLKLMGVDHCLKLVSPPPGTALP